MNSYANTLTCNLPFFDSSFTDPTLNPWATFEEVPFAFGWVTVTLITMKEPSLKATFGIGDAGKPWAVAAPLSYELVNDVSGGQVFEVVIGQTHPPAALRPPRCPYYDTLDIWVGMSFP